MIAARGKIGDKLFDQVRGDIIVVGIKLPADLKFRFIGLGGNAYDSQRAVPRGGLLRNDDPHVRIMGVSPSAPHRIVWVSGPSAPRVELLQRSPYRAVRRYVRWRLGWRGWLRKKLGLR